MKTRARRPVVGCAGGDSGGMECVDFRLARGDEADMDGARVGSAAAKPKIDPSVTAESLEIRMAFGAIGTVVIDGMTNAERRKRLFIKFD